MYVYNFGYSTHEESEYTQLMHKEKYTEEQFRQICIKAVVRAIEIIKEHIDKCQVENCKLFDMHPTFHTASNRCLTLQDLLDPSVRVLCNEMGFEQINFQAEWSGMGWGSVINKGSWSNEDIVDAVPEELQKWVLKKTKEQEEEFFKKYGFNG